MDYVINLSHVVLIEREEKMSFWDTVLGNELAHILIETLPEITRKKKQFPIICNSDEEVLEQMELLKQEYSFYAFIPLTDGRKIVIFEK